MELAGQFESEQKKTVHGGSPHVLFMESGHVHMSLGDIRFHANTERFQGLVPLWPHLCPLSVRLGGVCGSYSESP